jgi:hypothetical protein
MPCDLDKNIFGPFSLEMKLLSTKLYFTSLYIYIVLEFEKRKKDLLKNYKGEIKLVNLDLG